MTERNGIRRSLGWKAAANVILIAMIIGAAAVCISYRAYRQNLEDQMTRTAENLSRAAAAQVTAESIDGYLASGEKDEAYRQVESRLLEIQEYYGILNISCIQPSEDGFYYIYNTDQSAGALSLGEFQAYTYDGFRKLKAKLLTGEDIAPVREQNREAQGLYAMASIRDEAGQSHGYMAVVLSMDATIQAERDFLTHIICVLLLITAVLAVLSILTAQHILIKPVNQLTDAAESFVQRRRETAPDERIAPELPELHTGDEMERLCRAVRQMETDIQDYLDDLTAVTAEKERISAELNVATKIQASMLPCIFPPYPERREFDIYAAMTPAKEVGGDLYDFFLIDDDHLALVIADVSGKGVPAALFMVITKVLLKNSLQAGKAPELVLEEVNEQLCANDPIDMFVTAWIGVLELSTGVLRCANAGHEYPALRRADDAFALVKDPHGLVLAGMEGSSYRAYELALRPGDTLFVYTDGVPEASGGDNRFYGTERMLAALNTCGETTPQTLLAAVQADIDDFVGGAPQFDDITMLALRYNGRLG